MNWIPITEKQPEDGQMIIAKTIPLSAVQTKENLCTFQIDGKIKAAKFDQNGEIITHWKLADRLAAILSQAKKTITIDETIRLYDKILKNAPPIVKEWLESEVRDE